ncbi:hypothetical protein QWZ08_16300 [Ferruginibacter paludis]|uniref:hypothetical protein n=1 Tax=Ferruginibacter paludis TaxID=1310417 RepID=UPI0025B4799D|nr:hypothetical protein [Ferruginibacter paludis]MDN3657212.1 hypothetical protein [Ferruginibacter paludis]
MCSDIAWEVVEWETQRQKGISGDGFIVVTDVMERENKRISVKAMRGIKSFSMPGIRKMVKSIYRVEVMVDSDLIISLS